MLLGLLLCGWPKMNYVTCDLLSSDGITVIDAGEVCALAAGWRVWVTLQVPWTPISFLRELNGLSYMVNQSQLIHRGDGATALSNQSIRVSSAVQES